MSVTLTDEQAWRIINTLECLAPKFCSCSLRWLCYRCQMEQHRELLTKAAITREPAPAFTYTAHVAADASPDVHAALDDVAKAAARHLAKIKPAPASPFDKVAADRLADEVALLVMRGVIDSRSLAADALMDYRDPPLTERCHMLYRERKHETAPVDPAISQPAICQHREALKHLLGECVNDTHACSFDDGEIKQRVEDALVTPCKPAKGDAGEWELVAAAGVTDVGSSISMPVGVGRGTHVLTISGVQIHAGDRVTVYRRSARGRGQ